MTWTVPTSLIPALGVISALPGVLPPPLPRTAILTYHPSIPTPRGRGAWRVQLCSNLGSTKPEVISFYPGNQHHTPMRALRMPVARHLARGTWVNPTKLLREYLATQRLFSSNGG